MKIIRSKNEVLQDIILESTEAELRETLSEAGEDFDSLAAEGRTIVQNALRQSEKSINVQNLHRGLGSLLQLLRRREKISIEELSEIAQVDPGELRMIESDPTFNPRPRTIYQVERFFKLRPRSLVILSGSVEVEKDIPDYAVRFAAKSENITELNKEEQKLLNDFIKFLAKQADR